MTIHLFFITMEMKGEKIHVNCTSMACDVDETDGRLDLTQAKGGYRCSACCC